VQLRPYQQDAVDSAMEHLQRHNATMLVCPTGGGKTIMFGELIKRFLPRGRTMVIAHREELLAQSRDTIQAVTGIRPDLEMADSYACDGMYKSPIVVSSVQTQTAGRNGSRRMLRFDPHEFGLLIIDESHHAPADSYREVIGHYRQNPNLKLFGCTATPDRHDRQALGEIFESVCFNYDLVDAINEGWLVPVKRQYLNVIVDFADVRYTLGDFNGKDLRELLSQGTILEQIASDSIQYASNRRTLVFSDSVENAERITEVFNRHAMGSARIVTGETDKTERRKLIAAYRAGGFQFLVNVGVATEGFDVPEIACVVLARPTCSRSLYSQMAGRSTRPIGGVVDGIVSADARKAAIAASAKPDTLLLDIIGKNTKHRLITAADILGGKYSDEVIAKADAAMQESNAGCDVLEALEEAHRLHNAEIEAEAKRKGGLSLKKKSDAKDVDPFGIYQLQRPDYDDGSPMTGDQREKIDRWKIKASKDLTEAQANEIIGEVRSRARRGLLTLNQEVTLKRYKVETMDMSFQTASTLIDRLVKNGWKYL
jgi:superfamily II DNA or RNA helicase